MTNSLISSASANWPKTVQGVSANFLSGTDLNATWTLSGEATMWLQQNGVEAIASYLASESLSVAAGKRYEVSIYTASHRANAAAAPSRPLAPRES